MKPQISDEEFDKAMLIIIGEETGADERILSIPGMYEVLSEHFNNDIIELAYKIRKLNRWYLGYTATCSSLSDFCGRNHRRRAMPEIS